MEKTGTVLGFAFGTLVAVCTMKFESQKIRPPEHSVKLETRPYLKYPRVARQLGQGLEGNRWVREESRRKTESGAGGWRAGLQGMQHRPKA